ncbi:MAG TPA: ArgE/DapE family deacylase [Gemmatimonadaceae bacterium]|nr:ArgE/DapE family deacylase [Gemmatimonadaceae bacterium]
MAQATGAGSSGVPRGDAIALTRALTKIDSRNPTLVPGGPGERDVAIFLSQVLTEWGFSVELTDAADNRPNVIARVGAANSPALMFAGHLDIVGIDGMTHSPFNAEVRDGRIYGRGATDMKSGIASMCAAAAIAVDRIPDARSRQVVIAAVIDEEYASIGMRELVASGVTAEAAIITEPTRLAINPAHRGFIWIEITFTGRAAHGSRYDIGVDAIRHAGLVLAELDNLDAEVFPLNKHPLLGRGSLHASAIEGGSGLSTYPDRCVLTIERRTLPGDTAETSLQEVRDACDRVRATHPSLSAEIRLIESQLPSDVSVDAPVVSMLRKAMEEESCEVVVEGMSAWTDAAILNEAGIPAICYGPGDISLAHAAEEFVSIDEIERATAVLARMAQNWLQEKA